MITDVISRAVNLSNYQTSGFDFETRYSLPLSKWIDGAPGTLCFQYRLPFGGDSRIALVGNVANLFDREPPKLPNAALYDVIGRYYSVGLRANF
ncbi:MAG: hypothetical protein AB7P31_08435 [Steroidobacteraceae bacterium]